jgi:glycosyltransferase involved in cell wall biosynthesis
MAGNAGGYRERAYVRLLQVIGTLDPAYGGPPVVLVHLARGMRDLGHSVDTLTLDTPGEPWLEASSGEVFALGPSRGMYGYVASLVPWLRRHVDRYDAVVVHGIWQYQSFAVRRGTMALGVPYFVFPHGALDPWFKRAYPLKHLKKMLYWPWAEFRVLRDASAVLFMCDEERRLARESFRLYRANEIVVGFGIDEPPGDPARQTRAFLESHGHLRDKRFLLFLSRIHPKKGCDLLVRAFAAACGRADDLHLVMAGPDQSGWRHELAALAESLGVAERITWTGMLSGDAKWGAYRAADAFVLPSHSENFGIVVPEALACGLPVLLTNKVNIWREVEAAGAGLVANDSKDGIDSLLTRWLGLSHAERTAMRGRARGCFEANFELQRVSAWLSECLLRNARSTTRSGHDVAARRMAR